MRVQSWGVATLAGAVIIGTLVTPALVAPAVAASGPAPTPTVDSAAVSPPGTEAALSWTRCGSRKRVRECARLNVPIDYSDPEGPNVQIALARIPARDPAQRRGAIVMDPGGPGISGVTEILKYDSYLSDRLEDHYDVVGFDPRGVGASAPLWCRSTKQMDRYSNTLAAAQWSARADTAVVNRWAHQARLFGVGCARDRPDLVRHLGTIDAARDLDRIRAALGQPTLDYLGWSYGTKLGAVYADLFPGNVGRMVLDSAINPALDITQFNREQSRGMEAALHRFFRWCRSGRNCPLPRGRTHSTTALKQFLLGLPSRRTAADAATRADAMSALATTMYHPDDLYPVLRHALRRAFAGDGRPLIRLGGGYGDQDPDHPSNFLNALYAINCYDSPATAGVARTALLARRWGAAAPIFGAPAAWGVLRCHTFPAHTPIPTGPVSAPGAPPIVIIGARRDAATPVAWSRQLAGQLVSSRLIVADTAIHSVYPGVNRCVRRAVDRFFLRGDAPPRRSECPAD